MRIAISGGPLTGKTTLADQIGAKYNIPVYHTDDLIHLGWSEASEEAQKWFDRPGSWVIEGVAVSRALRKWRKYHPDQPAPLNIMIFLSSPHRERTKEQEIMAKGVKKVQKELDSWLEESKVDKQQQTEGVKTQ